MAQDEIPEQEMLNEQEQFPPQTDPEPEMGAAAAAVYVTSPPLLRNPPPIPAETAHPSVLDMILQAMNEMKTNAQEMNNKMDGMTKTLRDEMRKMGQCLQAGIMATPRAGTNELGGSARAVRLAVGAGEKKLIRETCWARSMEVTEEVTVTVREKLNGVTETCETRHVDTTERIKCTETREIESELDWVKETKREHTHGGSGGQWGRARGMSWDRVQAAG